MVALGGGAVSYERGTPVDAARLGVAAVRGWGWGLEQGSGGQGLGFRGAPRGGGD